MTTAKDPEIGKLITDKRDRDAIHMAIYPGIAAESLDPGQHVGFVRGRKFGPSDVTMGIVDPFLKENVEPDQEFWVFLYPNTITDLRHHWTHPKFPEYTEKQRRAELVLSGSESEEWIKGFADRIGLGFEEVIDNAKMRLRDDEHYYIFSVDTPDECDSEIGTFWEHFETLTGRKVSSDKKQSFFSCAC